MAQVHQAVASRDYPEHGIKKGDIYFYWKPYRQSKRFSKTRPKPSQVEANPTRSAYLAILEALDERIYGATDAQDLQDALREAAKAVYSITKELREKARNIEVVSNNLISTADEVDAWAYAMEHVIDGVDEPGEEPTRPDRRDFDVGEGGDSDYEDALTKYEFDYECWKDFSWEYDGIVKLAAINILCDAPTL